MVAGHLCIDLFPDLSTEQRLSDLAPGKLLTVGNMEFATGGAVANTGLALHVLGCDVRLVGKVGNDVFGKTISNRLENVAPGLSDHLIVTSGDATSYSLVLDIPGQDRCFLHHSGANDTFRSRDIDPHWLRDIDVLHLGYPPLMADWYANDGEELVRILELAKAEDIFTSLDMAFVDPDSKAATADWYRILQGCLPHVDLFMPSLDEIVFMLKQEISIDEVSVEELINLTGGLLELGAGLVAIKLGERGLFLNGHQDPDRLAALEKLGQDAGSWAGITRYRPCYDVEVQGATGAGDCTIAGFLAALYQGQDPEDCLRTATAVGACNVERPDALSGLISWDALQDRIRSGWSLHPSRISGDLSNYLIDEVSGKAP